MILFTKIKNLLLHSKEGLFKSRYTIGLALPFLLMDLFTRIFAYKINFFPAYYAVPNIFTILWVVLFIGLVVSLKEVFAKIAYWTLFIIFFVLFLTNNIYYSYTSFFFSFNLLKLTDEGSTYIFDTVINANPIIYLAAIIIVIITSTVFKLYFKNVPAKNKFKYKNFLIIFVVFIALHTVTPLMLGPANAKLKWNTFNNPRNTYETFNDSNKSFKVSGLYEYSIRGFYITFLKPKDKISSEDKAFLDDIYKTESTTVSDDYTGMFKDKNVIFLQLEGIDDWLLTKKTMPNLYELFNHSIKFTNHYSIYTGGGSTFNSEFATNTGFTTPFSYIENVYSFNKNTFDYTLAKLFKQSGYSVNAFHMNTSDFYSRGINYKSWGYDNYYGLLDIQKYTNEDYKLDRELILNKTFYEKMFKQNNKFLHYIITYSPHTPFTTQKEVGRLVAEKKYGNTNIPILSEEDSARLQVGETDYMIGLLMQALKDNNLYDNTVIVAFADHYLYTLEDKTILDKYKNTKNNLINHTPFFIWSSDVKPANVNEVTMQMDILPTVLNLFGIDYNDNYFIGNNALADNYEGYAFFTDYSWYDGSAYVEGKKVTNHGKISKKKLNELDDKISSIIKQNDLTLKYDYFAIKDK